METLLAFELVSTMTRADRGGERVAAGSFHKLDSFFRISERGMSFVHLDVLFDPPELSKFGLDADAFRVCTIHHSFCDRDVLFERLVPRINHHGTIKSR